MRTPYENIIRCLEELKMPYEELAEQVIMSYVPQELKKNSKQKAYALHVGVMTLRKKYGKEWCKVVDEKTQEVFQRALERAKKLKKEREAGGESMDNGSCCSMCGKWNRTAELITPYGQKIELCEQCLLEMLYDVNPERRPAKTKEPVDIQIPTPSKIKAELDKDVIGQDAAKEVLAVGIYNHYKRITSEYPARLQKSNILLVGPTGVGKTELARSAANLLRVPFAIADATSVTQAGYVGDDVENILLKLIQASNFDIEAAEKGIIYIDELDKIARKSDSPSITRDVSGEGVQHSLLKIIEGSTVSVPENGGRKHPRGRNISINTRDILFICGGAFEGLTMQQAQRVPIGFASEITKSESQKIDAKALVKAGLIPELVGRLPLIVPLNELSEQDLRRILVEPQNSIVKQYQNLLALDDVKLKFDKKAFDYIASKAYKEKTGARGLKAILENEMTRLMYELPDEPEVREVTVTIQNGELVCVKKAGKMSA